MAKISKNNGDMIAQNRRARFDYQIEETLEAGVMLMGTEVKSARLGRVSLTQSHAAFDSDGELYLYGCSIDEYTHAGAHLQHQPQRARKLLLKKSELNKLLGAVERQGITLVPLKLYFNKRGVIKLTLGVAKGKKLHEKRDTIKDRDWKRQQQRLLKEHN